MTAGAHPDFVFRIMGEPDAQPGARVVAWQVGHHVLLQLDELFHRVGRNLLTCSLVLTEPSKTSLFFSVTTKVFCPQGLIVSV